MRKFVVALMVLAAQWSIVLQADGTTNRASIVCNEANRKPIPRTSETRIDLQLRAISALGGRVERGLVESPIAVEILGLQLGDVAKYTLDGSEPGVGNGILYSHPIPIDKTTVARACVVGGEGTLSAIASHTYICLEDVLRQPVKPAGMRATVAGFVADYAVNTNKLTGLTEADYQRGLRALPIVSLASDLNSWFSDSTGIYANSRERGERWERRVSVEWIDSNRHESRQMDAGVRMHGGMSRDPFHSWKHSLRLQFRRKYGSERMHVPVFNDATAKSSFETLVLRAGSIDNVSVAGEAPAQYVIDEFARRTQLAMGSPAVHGRFIHLFLNGLYWGMYNLVERPDATFAADYGGGRREDWTVVHDGTVRDGKATMWTDMLERVAKLSAGMADGHPPQDMPNAPDFGALRPWIDLEQYCDYALCNFWLGNRDWSVGNWYALANHEEHTGFRFLVWDAEESLSSLTANALNCERLGAQAPFAQLVQIVEFRQLFSARARLHLGEGGALHPKQAIARYVVVAGEVESALPLELARWGDHRGHKPISMADWRARRDWMLTVYLPQRTAIVSQQLRAAGLLEE